MTINTNNHLNPVSLVHTKNLTKRLVNDDKHKQPTQHSKSGTYEKLDKRSVNDDKHKQPTQPSKSGTYEKLEKKIGK